MNRIILVGLTGLALMVASLGAFAQTSPLTPAPKPSPETMDLARTVAVHDDFLNLIGMVGAQQIAGLEKSLGDLTPAQKTKVDAIGEATLVEGENRVIDKLAAAYATKFSDGELRAMAAFLETPAGNAYSGRLPATLSVLGAGMKGFDFKREMLKETCVQIDRGCAPAPPANPPSTPKP